jgi:hypothetical protein
MGTGRGRGERSFVLETRRQVVNFYRDIVGNLSEWQAKAPKLLDPDSAPDATEDPRLSESPPAALPIIDPGESDDPDEGAPLPSAAPTF